MSEVEARYQSRLVQVRQASEVLQWPTNRKSPQVINDRRLVCDHLQLPESLNKKAINSSRFKTRILSGMIQEFEDLYVEYFCRQLAQDTHPQQRGIRTLALDNAIVNRDDERLNDAEHFPMNSFLIFKAENIGRKYAIDDLFSQIEHSRIPLIRYRRELAEHIMSMRSDPKKMCDWGMLPSGVENIFVVYQYYGNKVFPVRSLQINPIQ